ncbi:ATP-grasp domain-containing protein [Bacteroides nordii]|jgi:carbamoyl-phosphate synthase large subunit|uniref:ATP-grasp domain-containing protein n=1 Tax=Bacteroides nordii TaxID=291645 RepID=UPI00189D4D7C|nr:ATP-grasp domain-containing protein [Bacteroides nordii]
MNLLFLGGAKRVSIAEHFLSYGRKMDIEINIFSYELDEKVPIAAIGKVIKGLKWNDVSILDDIINVIKHYHIDIVLPFVDPAIVISAKLKQLCTNVFIPVSSEYICDVMFDKRRSAVWFEKNDITQPLYFSCTSDIQFPVIFKPRRGSASKGIFIANSLSEIPEDIDSDQYLIQEYISDRQEYSVDCYVSQKGHILSVVPRIRLETAGGEATKSLVVRDPLIIEEAEKILLTAEFYGPVTIQFIRDSHNGKIYVMEINPRLGGAVVASIGAGSEIISFIVNEAMGHNVSPVNTWKENTLMTRYFKEVIFYADNN